ncbi:MAG TPA: hypothetical protein VN363_06230 [Anaerolineales bacterium]|nr:hypothetical protein [Anaerolineales bacterium]
MNSTFIWVLVPLISGGILLLFNRYEKITAITGTIIAALLAILAWLLPIGETLPFLPSVTIQETLIILGRQFILNNTDRPYLLVIYLIVALWLGGARTAQVGRYMVPVGLIISGLLIAALAVEPPLYAALLIEMSALVSIPVLAPPGKPVSRGVLRFITFQTLGMPFILSSGWLLPLVVADPTSRPVITAIVLLLLGFALIAAIFPFHTWLVSLTEDINPYAAAFIFFLMLSNIALFGINFINRLEWLRNFTLLYMILRVMGSLMVLAGGLWAAFQRQLGRMQGQGMMVIIGSSLLALSLGGPDTGFGTPLTTASATGIEFFFAFFLPNALALAVWALALAIIRTQTEILTFRSLQGLAYRLPFASAGLLAAHFSLASLPLLAGFPLYLSLFSRLSAGSFSAAWFAVLGISGLMIGALRTLSVLFSNPEQQTTWSVTETRPQVTLLIIGVALLLLMGLIPQVFQPVLNIPIP